MKLLAPIFVLLTLIACGEPTTKTKADRLVDAARAQIGVTTTYDPAYVALKYPNGDIPMERGVCTDVVVRSLRKLDFDLQKLVHEDMKKNFRKYPKNWDLKKPDRNIDHRRVPNLRTYFKRRGISLKISKDAKDYKPGDFVTCLLSNNRPHIMTISDKKTDDGTPLVIHNIGRGAAENNYLFAFEITGHYRWFKDEG